MKGLPYTRGITSFPKYRKREVDKPDGILEGTRAGEL